MFENRPDIRDNWNFRVIIGDALKIIEETNRRIEPLLMFTNIIGKIAEKLFTDAFKIEYSSRNNREGNDSFDKSDRGIVSTIPL